MSALSNGSPSTPQSQISSDLPNDAPEGTPVETDEVLSVIESLKKRAASRRADYVKKRAEENAQKLDDVTKNLFKLSTERRNLIVHGADISVDLLSKRKQDAIYMQNGIQTNTGDSDSNGSEDDGYASSAILLGSSIAVKDAMHPIQLPEVKRLPPFTTWIFLDRNQRMTEDQSVVGRRRIYYDQNGGEALICSDSEEELLDDEEEKREFVESEDFMLRMAIKKVGLSDRVLDLLGQCLSRKLSEVKARYEDLVKEENACTSRNENIEGTLHLFLDKALDVALDSFDNLFCRRCLVFDCRLHGCSQDLIFAAEKQLPWYSLDMDMEPCGPNCCHLAMKKERKAGFTSSQLANHGENPVRSSEVANIHVPGRKHLSRRSKSCQSESASSNAKNISESSDSEIKPSSNISSVQHSASPSNKKSDSKVGSNKRNNKRIAKHAVVAIKKRQKKMIAVESGSVASGSLASKDMNPSSNSGKDVEDVSLSSQKVPSHSGRRSRSKDSPVLGSKNSLQGEGFSCQYKDATSEDRGMNCDDTLRKSEFVDENNCKQEIDGDISWRPLEKALFEKGLEMFGRSSCMIARNMMNGLKTCWEVFQYMNNFRNKLSGLGDGMNGILEGSSKGDGHTIMGNQARRRSRFLRRRGKVRRSKYTWKSAGYHATRKWISERKDKPCRQYNPCNCQAPCGKECPCIVNGTCCEKYCGCQKSCKNKFRGCHCAKSQCRSRQCPCFAADRECDPDVCRNCWISCGDGSLGIPSQRGDNYECKNMKLLLKQQQSVLLGRSDVSGWGAFLKNSVGKHEYLGEYTGEIISHHEADKRGKIYDRENSSFLFNLNNQFVLDAHRKGDKLKFANHSPDPNCYAKVIMVAGDHRVGIFAKERMSAGEELFYDYHYAHDRAPAWARKPEASGSKKEYAAPSSGRAKKHT
ncbi:histone-lysine N-methyltransferase CLF-like isoform X2 [Nicotiana tabacum]|uniref:[histone H3]-lysine(27) N-trimethyltransferase n=2 Tax=Nicotiana TaxID=4085 RepID=A0A1S4ANJ2_TOBAC|nr:PREDICTED: histone-lysine N-methyltransferase CLF-like [Nicotiana sylvestris]XP_009795143.1 PREDICTED: histone-lysine N-methyltransferase CLF-like [Nicotiana sylvestris]XP_016478214.1 PREDICTED: histone-lysine N-methyltransferase CLF-like [Nicotiana tabacum]